MTTKLTVSLWRAFLVVAILAGLIPEIDRTAIEISSWYDADRDKSFHRAMAWLRENSDENDIILTPWQFGAQVPAFTGRRVIASSKVYPSEAKAVAERYSDLKSFFQKIKTEDEAIKIANKYNTKFVFFQTGWRVNKNTLLDKMNKKEEFGNFTLAYDSGRHTIYRVAGDNNDNAEMLIEILAGSNNVATPEETILAAFPVDSGIALNFHGEILFPDNGVSETECVDFLFSTSEKHALEIAKKHNIDLIVLGRSLPPWMEKYKEKFPGYFSEKSDELTIKGRTTIFGRMINLRKMNNFELALSTNEYLLYRVNEPLVLRHFTRDFGSESELIALFDKNNIDIPFPSRVYGCVIPHLLPSAELRRFSAQLLDVISSNQTIDTIIILGPDHFNSGKGNISVSLRDWVSPFGIIETDREKSSYLINEGLAQVDEEAHEAEHSIIASLPLIKYKFPKARIVPILLKRKVSPEDAGELGRAISDLLDETTLLIVSCDLSHFYSPEEAYLWDKESIEAIRNFKKDKLYDAKIDCPAGIYALLTAMEHKGALKTKVLARDDSSLARGTKGVVGYCTLIFTKE